MASIKDLFNKDGKMTPGQILASTSLEELSGTAESSRNIKAKLKDKKRFLPPLDYSDPKNFGCVDEIEPVLTNLFAFCQTLVFQLIKDLFM